MSFVRRVFSARGASAPTTVARSPPPRSSVSPRAFPRAARRSSASSPSTTASGAFAAGSKTRPSARVSPRAPIASGVPTTTSTGPRSPATAGARSTYTPAAASRGRPFASTADRTAGTSSATRGCASSAVGSAVIVIRSAPISAPRVSAARRVPPRTAGGNSATATPQIVPWSRRNERTGRWRSRLSATRTFSPNRIRLRYSHDRPDRRGDARGEDDLPPPPEDREKQERRRHQPRAQAHDLRLADGRRALEPRRVEGAHVAADAGGGEADRVDVGEDAV